MYVGNQEVLPGVSHPLHLTTIVSSPLGGEVESRARREGLESEI